jgi:hypothetical protein
LRKIFKKRLFWTDLRVLRIFFNNYSCYYILINPIKIL